MLAISCGLDPAFVTRLDAWSRVLIWAINHADSPEIARIGNLC